MMMLLHDIIYLKHMFSSSLLHPSLVASFDNIFDVFLPRNYTRKSVRFA